MPRCDNPAAGPQFWPLHANTCSTAWTCMNSIVKGWHSARNTFDQCQYIIPAIINIRKCPGTHLVGRKPHKVIATCLTPTNSVLCMRMCCAVLAPPTLTGRSHAPYGTIAATRESRVLVRQRQTISVPNMPGALHHMTFTCRHAFCDDASILWPADSTRDPPCHSRTNSASVQCMQQARAPNPSTNECPLQ